LAGFRLGALSPLTVFSSLVLRLRISISLRLNAYRPAVLRLLGLLSLALVLVPGFPLPLLALALLEVP
jgi:hypothetical protein